MRKRKKEKKKRKEIALANWRIRRLMREVWIGKVDLIYLWIRAKCIQRIERGSPYCIPTNDPSGDSPRGNTSLGSTVCAIECTLILTNLFLILCHRNGACIEIRRLSTKPTSCARAVERLNNVRERKRTANNRASAYGQRSRVCSMHVRVLEHIR